MCRISGHSETVKGKGLKVRESNLWPFTLNLSPDLNAPKSDHATFVAN